jgi:hypothetical protein
MYAPLFSIVVCVILDAIFRECVFHSLALALSRFVSCNEDESPPGKQGKQKRVLGVSVWHAHVGAAATVGVFSLQTKNGVAFSCLKISP